ncbi:MAG: bactofilin family protein [Alphaproteobacteria bacterium]|jgi:cytoskeletal protein CcmA (bactofilin family)
MFSKDSKDKDRVPSIISSGLHIVGNLVSEGDVQVDGIIEGDVNARSVTVSEGAAIKGQIRAESACVRGTVEGEISANRVELGRTAQVAGDILHVELSIDVGAFLEGHCRRLAEPQKIGKAKEGETPAPTSVDKPVIVS